MSFWTAAVIVVAIWGIVQAYKTKNGIVSDEYGNDRYVEKRDQEAEREIQELRDRIKVLERIATDKNSEAERLASQIEDLRKD